MGWGLLNISASCLAQPEWAFITLILSLIQRPLSCWRWWESSGKICHLFVQQLCSMLGTSMCYCQSSRAGWIFTTSHPPFRVSEIIRDWFDCNMRNLFSSMRSHGLLSPTGDFPLLPPQHAQFPLLHWQHEMWPLLPPCGWQFDHSTWGWQSILPAWTSLTTAEGPGHPSVLGPSPSGARGDLCQAMHSVGFKTNQTLMGLSCCQTGSGRCSTDWLLGSLRPSYSFTLSRSSSA